MLSNKLIEEYLLTDDLSTYDPYDIWKTNLGIKVKQLYYKNKSLGLLPAGILTLYDLYLNNSFRLGYKKQEYPIVRAQACLALLNLYSKEKKDIYLEFAQKHIDWLVKNSSKGYSGYCWGISFVWASKNGTYDKNMPHVTHTPYALEAIVKYQKATVTNKYNEIIKSIFNFLEKDIKIMFESNDKLAISYAPVNEPRIVINANSYIIYMYSLLLNYLPNKKEYIKNKIYKIYNFISDKQKEDGRWSYYADTKSGNFIDNFHSAFVIKNIYKTNRIVKLEGCDKILKKAYIYLEENFYDNKYKLYKRFTVSDKPNLIKFDLYDNSEMLYILNIFQKKELLSDLKESIQENFIKKHQDIFSKILNNGKKMDKNTLRWAVMPYIYNLSEVE